MNTNSNLELRTSNGELPVIPDSKFATRNFIGLAPDAPSGSAPDASRNSSRLGDLTQAGSFDNGRRGSASPTDDLSVPGCMVVGETPSRLPESLAPAGARITSDLAHETQPARVVKSPELSTLNSQLSTQKVTDAGERDAEEKAALCREFKRLTEVEHLSLNQAATALGKSPSWFSGDNSPYARWARGGAAALRPAARVTPTETLSDITREIEALGWFIPAAKFFNLNLNRNYNSGSVPEAIRRAISLPNLPTGWTHSYAARFCKVLNLEAVPVCPAELREKILAREKAGKPLVPTRIARQISIPATITQRNRSPREWSLNTLSAPGSQRRYFDAVRGGRFIMAPGDLFGGDDATPGIAVCVPCNEVITPCSGKYGVLLGRFQWLAFNDCRTDNILAWDYVVRPRGSYRAEDILNGMGTVVRTHGIPRKGFQFEGGTFNAKLVQQAIKAMCCEHWRTYSPHAKAIESVFNRIWTRLSVQFPHADMGRYRAENESNCKLYENCKKGHADPRKYFPTLALVVAVFDEEVRAHNLKTIRSEQYGQWIPDELFQSAVAEKPLRDFSEEMDWIFSPFATEIQVRNMVVRCRVPMFEDFSVPFEFNAPWLPLHNGKKVRIHFNPRQPKCTAKVVLLENSGTHRAGDILGDAQLIGETTGYIRLIMGWADDDQRAGYVARQRTANYLRRISRGIGAGGRVVYATDEQRDGIGAEQKVTNDKTATPAPAPEPSTINSQPSTASSRSAKAAELEAFERNNEHLFL